MSGWGGIEAGSPFTCLHLKIGQKKMSKIFIKMILSGLAMSQFRSILLHDATFEGRLKQQGAFQYIMEGHQTPDVGSVEKR